MTAMRIWTSANLSVKIPRHKALPQESNTVHRWPRQRRFPVFPHQFREGSYAKRVVWGRRACARATSLRPDLDPGAIDQQAQRTFAAALGDVNGQGFLTAVQCAEVGHRPVEANQAQQAFDEPFRLP